MRKMLGPWRELAYNGKSFLQDLESIFPELRESEDERARKAALEGIEYLERKLGWDAIGDTDILDVKEYLEKQKVENHDGKKWIYEDDYHKDMERCFNDGKDEVLENPEKYGLQKEQKPAEWSEEDEDAIQQAILALEDRYDEHEPNLCFLGYKLPFNKAAERLKTLRPSWKPSEEQISSLKQARDYYMSGRIKYVGQHLSEIAEQLEKL